MPKTDYQKLMDIIDNQESFPNSTKQFYNAEIIEDGKQVLINIVPLQTHFIFSRETGKLLFAVNMKDE